MDLVPCEATFERLAAEDPARLLAWISDGTLRPAFLTFAAEHAGAIADSAAVRAALVPLLAHEAPVVREGTLYGLAACDRGHIDDATRATIVEMAERDPSPGVRQAATGVLEGLDD